MSKLQDYHDFYLMTDVLLLADVFEDFRNTGMTYYNLDPARYWTLPGNSWDGMLQFVIEYPDNLHDLHNCLPVAPENIQIKGLKNKWQFKMS